MRAILVRLTRAGISHVFPLERISQGFQEADWMQPQGGAAPVSRAAVALA